MTLQQLLSQLSALSVLAPFVAGLVHYQRLRGVRLSAWLLCTVALFPQLIRFVTREKTVENSLYNGYTFVEFTIMLLLLWRLAEKKMPVVFSGLIAGFIAIAVWIYRHYDIEDRFFFELACYDNLSYTLLIMLIIYQQMDQEHFFLQTKQDSFWFIISIMIYAPVTVFTLSLWKQMHEPPLPAVITAAMIINDVANILLYTGFTVGMLHPSKRRPL